MRKIICWTALVVVVPPLLLVLFEFGLRTGGYGMDTRFLLSRRLGDVDYWVVNPGFYQQFLSNPVGSIMDVDDLGFQVPKVKAVDTVRILILGDSAVHGCTPDSAFGFSRFLEVLLANQFPGKQFEVCNAACPALNSSVMREAARSCRLLQPDIVIVYMGNNEFIGPFGPGVTGPQLATRSTIDRWIWMRTFRIVQLLGETGSRWIHANTAADFLDLFIISRHDGPERAAMHEYYKQNVETICRYAHEAGAKTIVCTVASNLLDWKPFGSLNRPGISSDSRQQWQSLFSRGRSKETVSDFEAAVDLYTLALKEDESSAELQYRLGKVLAQMSRFPESLEHLRQARDYDALPLRVDSWMNESLLKMAGRSDVEVVDVEGLLYPACPNGLPDKTIFWDFVHYNFHGTYLFARNIFAVVASHVSPGGEASPLSEEECAAWLGYNDAVLLSHVKHLLPAFSFWKVPAENMRWIEGLRDDLERKLGTSARSAERAGYEKAHELNPKDYRIRERLTEALLEDGGMDAAMDMSGKLVTDFPLRRGSYLIAAKVAVRMGREAEAREILTRLRQIYPDARVDLAELGK